MKDCDVISVEYFRNFTQVKLKKEYFYDTYLYFTQVLDLCTSSTTEKTKVDQT